MSELVDRAIAALRTEHDTLAGLVADLTPDQLDAPSGASEWSVAQVLSHLGSGAEIGLPPIVRATGEQVEAQENQEIWARWDGLAAQEQASGFVETNARWLATVEALTPEQRGSLVVDLGFLPEPVPLVTALGMRLNEVANHSWDVRVALDPQAEIAPTSAPVLVELFQGPIGFLLGWLAKSEAGVRASVAVPAAGATLVLGETVGVRDGAGPADSTLDGPAGALIRLLNGRLKEPYADQATLTGVLTLEQLGQVFPGF